MCSTQFQRWNIEWIHRTWLVRSFEKLYVSDWAGYASHVKIMTTTYFFKSATHTRNLSMFTLCRNPFIFSKCFVPAGRLIHSFESCTNTLRNQLMRKPFTNNISALHNSYTPAWRHFHCSLLNNESVPFFKSSSKVRSAFRNCVSLSW